MTSEQSPILAATIPHSEPLADPTGPIRRSVYTLLIVIGVALILTTNSVVRRFTEYGLW